MPRKELVPQKDSPELLAYRVGKLEDALKEGLHEVNAKLDNIINQYPTRADVETMVTLALVPINNRLDVSEAERVRREKRNNWILGILGSVVSALTILLITNLIAGRV